MIILYVTQSCLGCRKAKSFFIENNIEFEEKDFTKIPFTEKELKDILKLTENGLSDIVSTRSKSFSLIKDINDMSISKAIELLIKNPRLIYRPIIIQYDSIGEPLRLLIGYDHNDIEIFLRKDNEKNYIKNNQCPFLNECFKNKECLVEDCHHCENEM